MQRKTSFLNKQLVCKIHMRAGSLEFFFEATQYEARQDAEEGAGSSLEGERVPGQSSVLYESDRDQTTQILGRICTDFLHGDQVPDCT